MNFFSWQPLTPSDIIQAVAVPVTAYVSYLIFSLGRDDEHQRLVFQQVMDASKDCLEFTEKLRSLGICYYTTSKSTDRPAMSIEIMLGMKTLSTKLGRLCQLMGYRNDHFSSEHFGFSGSVTGGSFGSAKFKNLGINDPVVQNISSAADVIVKRINSVVSESKPRKND